MNDHKANNEYPTVGDYIVIINLGGYQSNLTFSDAAPACMLYELTKRSLMHHPDASTVVLGKVASVDPVKDRVGVDVIKEHFEPAYDEIDFEDVYFNNIPIKVN